MVLGSGSEKMKTSTTINLLKHTFKNFKTLTRVAQIILEIMSFRSSQSLCKRLRALHFLDVQHGAHNLLPCKMHIIEDPGSSAHGVDEF